MLIDGGILLDEEIPLGHIGLWLVIVVVRDEVLHRIAGEELTHLGVELSRQGLVGRQNKGWPAGLGNDVGHGEGFSRASHPKQGLIGKPLPKPLAQARNGLRLVTGWAKRCHQFKGAVWVGNGV